MATRSRAVAVCTLLVLDALWLIGGGAGARFLDRVASFSDVVPWSAWQLLLFVVLAYVLLAAALCVFALPAPPAEAAKRGALLGLVIYGVFDLSNLCLFGRSYGVDLAATDVAWGTFVMGASALAGSLSA